MRKIFLSVLALSTIILAGCSSITNLTPSKLPRNPTGFYQVEAAWNSRQRTIRYESMKPIVMVGTDVYEMRRVPRVENRWETMIPIAADKDAVRYQFKFDYMVNSIPRALPDSKMSPEYKLQILDKK
ncbi:MAG: hypothetical protein ACXWBP_04605 [Limisphaerales bacterium]